MPDRTTIPAADVFTPHSYSDHRRRLLAETFPRAALVAFGTTALYAIGDFIKNPRFFEDITRIIVELAVPLVAYILVRGPLRERPTVVALGFDAVFTVFMATAMLAPTNTTSGTALFLTLKMVGSALLLRWDPRIQAASSIGTMLLYYGIFFISGVSGGLDAPIHQMIGPFIGAFFSIIGAYSIDHRHNELFEQNVRLAESEAQLRSTLRTERALLKGVQEANRLQNEFVNNVSHELRTPLNVISGYSELLQNDPRVMEDEETRFTVERLRTVTRGFQRLVESVLEYAQLDRSITPVHAGEFPADKILDALRDLSRDVHHNDRVQIDIDPAPGLTLHTDYHRLYTVLSNLLLNSCKFTREGYVHIGAEAQPDGIEFHISDTGVGIPPDQLDHVFEPFRQVDGSNTRDFGGVGLGLSIVRRNMELLGGRVDVDSIDGRGTSIRLLLPDKC